MEYSMLTLYGIYCKNCISYMEYLATNCIYTCSLSLSSTPELVGIFNLNNIYKVMGITAELLSASC